MLSDAEDVYTFDVSKLKNKKACKTIGKIVICNTDLSTLVIIINHKQKFQIELEYRQYFIKLNRLMTTHGQNIKSSPMAIPLSHNVWFIRLICKNPHNATFLCINWKLSKFFINIDVHFFFHCSLPPPPPKKKSKEQIILTHECNRDVFIILEILPRCQGFFWW